MDPTRLKSQLLTTGLQNKDNPLFQVINQLIDALGEVRRDVGQTGSLIINSGTTISGQNQAIGPPGMDGLDGSNEYFFIPSTDGSGGISRVYDSPLTNGDPVSPELIFDDFGDVIIVQVPY